MAPNQYREILRARIKNAIKEAEVANKLTHNGVKGLILEILISKIFRPLLPSDLGIGTGHIISQPGTISKQIDIILYDRGILPPALYDESTGLFPVEASLYAIEVKTTLTSKGLKLAHESAVELRKFRYMAGRFHKDGTRNHHPIEKVRNVVFALNSDLRGAATNEAERYEKVYRRKSENPHIAAICVAGKEYCYDDGRHWRICKGSSEHEEILGFLAGVTNTYKNVAASRHSPSLGDYIAPLFSPEVGTETGKSRYVQMTCSSCGHEVYTIPQVPKVEKFVVNGEIHHSEPCSQCGGLLKSLAGTYTFINGVLTV